MQLLTVKLKKKLPRWTKGKDPMIYCHLFTPDSSWDWYVMAWDGQDTLFGLVKGFFPELGSFSLTELESIRGAFGLPVERDLFFEPCRLSALEAKLGL